MAALALLAPGALAAVPAAAQAPSPSPSLASAVGLSRTVVRVTFSAAVAPGAVRAEDFALSMGNEGRPVSTMELAPDGLSARLESGRAWTYGTAGTVTLAGGPPVRVWASPGDSVDPVLSRVRLDRRVVCSKGVSAGCERSGGTVRFRIDEPATILLDLRRRGSSAPSVEKHPFGAGRGAITFHEKIEGRRLRPGSYELLVTAVDAAGNSSRTVVLPLRVRR
jgi:hypothetical protein